jgi:hypothetical protein
MQWQQWGNGAMGPLRSLLFPAPQEPNPNSRRCNLRKTGISHRTTPTGVEPAATTNPDDSTLPGSGRTGGASVRRLHLRLFTFSPCGTVPTPRWPVAPCACGWGDPKPLRRHRRVRLAAEWNPSDCPHSSGQAGSQTGLSRHRSAQRTCRWMRPRIESFRTLKTHHEPKNPFHQR